MPRSQRDIDVGDRRKLTPAGWLRRIDTIHRMERAGASDAAMGAALGVSRSTIAALRPWALSQTPQRWREIVASGGEIRPPVGGMRDRPGPKRHDRRRGGLSPAGQARRARVQELWAQGLSGREIHRREPELGNYATVLRDIHQAPPRPEPARPQPPATKTNITKRTAGAKPKATGRPRKRRETYQPRQPKSNATTGNGNEAWMLRIETVLRHTAAGMHDGAIARQLGLDRAHAELIMRYARSKSHREWVAIYENHGDVRPGWARELG